MVTYHKQLAFDVTKVKGGGGFKFDRETKTFTLFGRSHDFGQANLEDISNCIMKQNKKDDFKTHDVVVLKTDVSGIPKGTRGTIVFDYENSGMFEVEFFDDEHNTIGLERIFKGDLKKWVK